MKQESLFCWFDSEHYGWVLRQGTALPTRLNVSAFTVAELIELLGTKFGVLERFDSGKFGAYIPRNIDTSATGEKVADVLAKLLMQVYEDPASCSTPGPLYNTYWHERKRS